MGEGSEEAQIFIAGFLTGKAVMVTHPDVSRYEYGRQVVSLHNDTRKRTCPI